MTETKKPFMSFGEIVFVAVFLACLCLFVFIGNKYGNDRERAEEFEAVCSYEGGTVEGEVCIRDEKVILYKKTLDLEHQD